MRIQLSPSEAQIAARCLFEAYGAVDHPDWKGPATLDTQAILKLRTKLAGAGSVSVVGPEVELLARAIGLSKERLGPHEFQTVMGFGMPEATALQSRLI